MRRSHPARFALFFALASCSSQDQEPAAPVGIDETFLDRTADPCSDFYQFACGTWIREHAAPPGYSNSRFFEGDNRHDIYFQKLITDATEVNPDIIKAKAFNDSCVNARMGLTSDARPLGEQLDAIANMSTPADMATTLANLHAAGVHALFFAAPTVDPGDPSRRVIELWDWGWSLTSKKDYVDPQSQLEVDYKSHMLALKDLAATSLRGIGSTSADGVFALDVSEVFTFEGAVAQATETPAEQRDAVAAYNLTDEAALQSMVPAFDWTTYFVARGFGVVPQVVIGEPAFFAALQTLLSTTSLDVLKQYLIWRVLEAEAAAVGKSLSDEEFNFHSGVLFGRTQVPPDWWVCLNKTRDDFGFALAQPFVARFVPGDTKARATRIVDQIRSAMLADIDGISWLDDATRARAKEKLDAVLAKVAYPSTWPTYADLVLAPGASFLDNWLAVRRQYSAWAAESLAKPVDRAVFALSPDTTNARYSPTRNDITIPVAVLEVPFFSDAWPDTLNFGSIGSLIGHEMTHGFDDEGRRFDGSGKLTNWWTESVGSEFSRRAQCIADQFGAYEPIPGGTIDGALTLGENIADLGGLKLAYAASRSARSSDSLALPFSADQQFFLSFAQLWCANESPALLAQTLKTDPHSPARFRVNGAVRNVPEFAEAFQCAAGSPLAPSATERCELW